MPPTLSRNKQRWPFLGRADSWGPGWGQSPPGRVSSPRQSPHPACLWPGPVGAQVQRHHPPSSRHLLEASRGSRGPGGPGQEDTHFSLPRDGGNSQLYPHPAHRIGGSVTESRGQVLPWSRLPSTPGGRGEQTSWTRHMVTHLGCNHSGGPPASPEPPCVKSAEARQEVDRGGSGELGDQPRVLGGVDLGREVRMGLGVKGYSFGTGQGLRATVLEPRGPGVGI